MHEGGSEAQRILSAMLSELPEQAETLVDKVKGEITRIEEEAEEKIASIRERAEGEVAAVRSKIHERGKTLLGHAIDQLSPLQKDLFARGELAQALAVFMQIQMLKAQIDNMLPDPGNLLRFQTIGKSHRFRVIGNGEGPVWGTDVYTADSHLATAAVHAGALEMGEEGVVDVTILDTSAFPIRGSLQNGVMSYDWGPYPLGFRVSRWQDGPAA